MPEFTVSWSIDVDAKTPEDAARVAREIMLDEHSMATVFDVADPSGSITRIDLLGLSPVLVTMEGYILYKQSDGSYTDHVSPEQKDILRFEDLRHLREALTLGVFRGIKPLFNHVGRKSSNHRRSMEIAVVLEGGIVQSIISNAPSMLPDNILVIDYDRDGWEDDDLSPVVQDNGMEVLAHVYQIEPELPRINLDAVFEMDD